MAEATPLPTLRPSAVPWTWGRRIDVLCGLLVVLFAVICASFIARNSDVWLHLATGRLLASGNYRFGVDPFAYTTSGEYWANHAWLFDLGLFGAYRWLGGAGLVAMKSAAAGVTAVLMLLTARHRGPAWVAIGCVMLAILAISPRLLLQPTFLSLLLLAGCLYCLRVGGRAFRLIPVLIVLWVNVDAWFILGPVLMGLFWLGRRIDPTRAGEPPWPWWLFPAALGACLLSPHHIYAIQLPLELSPAVWTSEFRADPRFAGLFVSPWRWAPLGPAGGYNLAGWAFFVLFGLGLVSFTLNRRAVRSWRLMVWLPFAALAAWQARLIPFFAVVAAPITALNWRELLADRPYSRSGRSLVFAGAAALLALGWLGWTNGVHNRERGAAWGVSTDPTLARLAGEVAVSRQTSGQAGEVRILSTHPDVAHYLAWFAPGERYFLDSRLQLFTHVAGDYTAISQAVGLIPQADGAAADEVLRQHAISEVLLHDPDAGRMTRALETLAKGNDWAIARIDGATVVLMRRGVSGTQFDPERAAFGDVSRLGVAQRGPPSLAEPNPWEQLKRNRGRSGSWEADAATVYLRLTEFSGSNSPALPLLAIRASRVGIESDPRDSLAWLALGRSYALLGERTWEREAGSWLSLLGHVRFLQQVGALVQAVVLNPDSIPAHDSLARVFLARNMLDVSHKHARATVRLVQRAGPQGNETTAAFRDRLAGANKLVETLEFAVQDAENRFLIRTAGMEGDPLARARAAVSLGLTQKAIDVLLASHPDLYGVVGVGLLADLLLQTGQAAEARTLLDRDELRRNPNALGFYNLARQPNRDGTRWTYRLHAYDWLNLCHAAVAGNYTAAADAIDRLCTRWDTEEAWTTPMLKNGIARLLAREVGMSVPPRPIFLDHTSLAGRLGYRDALARNYTLSVSRADLFTLAGVLELERGDVRSAAKRFDAARELYAQTPIPTLSRPGEALATRYDGVLREHR